MKPKLPLNIEQAREKILAKLVKAGPKGAASLHPKTVSDADAQTYARAVESLAGQESPGIYVDRRAPAKPKYFLWSVRPKLPTAETVAAKLLAFAESEHPRIHSAATLIKKLKLTKDEKPLAEDALQLLCDRSQLTALEFAPTARRTTLYAVTSAFHPAAPLAAVPASSPEATAPGPLSLDTLKPAYDGLVAKSGFPAVPIAALQKAAGVPMASLKDLLRRERDSGEVVLSIGDWSIAGEEERQGVIEMHGRNYILVEWQA